MKKKLLAVLLVMAMAGSVAACGGSSAPAAEEAATEEATEETAEEAAPAEEAAEETTEAEAPAEEAAEEPAAEAPAPGANQASAQADLGVGATVGNDEVMQAAKESGEVVIGVSIPQLENPYFVSVQNGIQNVADELGYKVQVVDAGYDVAKQVSDFEDFMNQGVTAVIACPIDSNALEGVTKEMNEAGIAVISFAQLVPNANTYFTGDEYTYGVAIGKNVVEWINTKLDGKGNVLIISQDNVEAVVRRGDGIQDTIEENCPDAVIVARQAGDNPESGMKIAENVMMEHPEVNVIVGNNDAGPLGAVEAVKAMNLDEATLETFFVGGADATPEAIAKMAEEGSIYRATVDITPYRVGQNCVRDLASFIEAGHLPVGDEVMVNYWDMVPVWQDDVLAGWTPEG